VLTRRSRSWRDGRAIAAVAVCAVAAALVAAHAGSLPSTTELYIDPDSQVVQWVNANPTDSRQPLIASRIASQPRGIWFSRYSPSTVTSDAGRVTSAAAAAGKVPVLVAYMIPNRDCGGASAGGAPDIASYDTWVQRFAAGLGSRRVIVILEPTPWRCRAA
jgi:endoglucanase